MRTFEYKWLNCSRLLDVVPELNRMGEDGWEAVFRETDTGRDYSYLMVRVKGADEPAIQMLQTLDGPVLHVPLDADAASGERFTHRLVPRIPPDTRIPWSRDRQPAGAVGPRETVVGSHHSMQQE